ncbi:MAG: hypothetical protein J5818_03255 [Eggerthellaceae bacterium]|nr:hypothetical protein [Eggerthellaceae bacterium]
MFNRQDTTIDARWTGRLVAAATLVLMAVLVLAGCSGGTTVKESMSKYSWAELSAISTEISEAESDAAGREIATEYNLLNSSGKIDTSTKEVRLSDGTDAHVMLAGIRHDDLSSGGKAGLTFVFTDAPIAHAMNGSASNDGGWEKSEMREWLNEDFAGMLPSDLKGAIKAVNKKTNNSAYTSPGSVSSTSDKLWLLSLVEIGGSVSPNDIVGGSGIPAATYNAEGKQYQVFSEMKVSGNDDNAKLERTFTGSDGNGIVMSGEPCSWWQRSLSMTWTSGFAAVDAEGNPLNAWITDYELGVVPGFSL